MRFFLLLIFLSFSIFAVDEVDFSDIKMEKGKNKTKTFSKNGILINTSVIILGFPEELSISSMEAHNVSSLCDIENINMTKISKIEADFQNGYPNGNVKCFNRKDKVFYEENLLPNNVVEIMKYDVNGILDQRKRINGSAIEYTSFYDNGTILKEGNYINNQKNGVWKEYYKDGNIKSITNFKKNKIVNIEKF
ncbi:MAG: hypothetical protein KBF12_01435 [Sebaldella sp.]|nr:hypothetical protein [Sebaldella sp.]